MFVTNLLSIRVFVIIYGCLICKYVMIFSKRYLESLECWMMVVGCLMLGVDGVIFGLLSVG